MSFRVVRFFVNLKNIAEEDCCNAIEERVLTLMAEWSSPALSRIARCLSTLPRFEYRTRHVRRLPVN